MHPSIMNAGFGSMQSNNYEPGRYIPIVITSKYLSALDRSLLLGLLIHKTQLLITARNAGIADLVYINDLYLEIKKIHAELWVRKVDL